MQIGIIPLPGLPGPGTWPTNGPDTGFAIALDEAMIPQAPTGAPGEGAIALAAPPPSTRIGTLLNGSILGGSDLPGRGQIVTKTRPGIIQPLPDALPQSPGPTLEQPGVAAGDAPLPSHARAIAGTPMPAVPPQNQPASALTSDLSVPAAEMPDALASIAAGDHDAAPATPGEPRQSGPIPPAGKDVATGMATTIGSGQAAAPFVFATPEKPGIAPPLAGDDPAEEPATPGKHRQSGPVRSTGKDAPIGTAPAVALGQAAAPFVFATPEKLGVAPPLAAGQQEVTPTPLGKHEQSLAMQPNGKGARADAAPASDMAFGSTPFARAATPPAPAAPSTDPAVTDAAPVGQGIAPPLAVRGSAPPSAGNQSVEYNPMGVTRGITAAAAAIDPTTPAMEPAPAPVQTSAPASRSDLSGARAEAPGQPTLIETGIAGGQGPAMQGAAPDQTLPTASPPPAAMSASGGKGAMEAPTTNPPPAKLAQIAIANRATPTSAPGGASLRATPRGGRSLTNDTAKPAVPARGTAPDKTLSDTLGALPLDGAITPSSMPAGPGTPIMAPPQAAALPETAPPSAAVHGSAVPGPMASATAPDGKGLDFSTPPGRATDSDTEFATTMSAARADSLTAGSVPASAPGGASPIHALHAPAPPPSTGTAHSASATITAQPGKIGHEAGVAIAHRIVDGGDEVTLRLNPAELGRIEVKISFEDGNLRATMRADNPAALDLLRRDSADLGRALDQAGIRADTGNFRFESRTSDGGQQGAPRQPHTPPGSSPRPGDDQSAAAPVPLSYRPIRTNGRVDLVA